MKTYENYITWLLLSSTKCLTQDLLTQQKCGSWHQLKARCYSNSTNVLVGFSQLLFYLFGGCCHSISQPWSASTVLSKLQVVPALTVFHNRKPSFCFLSLRQVLPPRLFVVFRPHCKWNQRFLASLVWKRDLQGMSRDHVWSWSFSCPFISLSFLWASKPWGHCLRHSGLNSRVLQCMQCMTAAWLCLKQRKFDTTSITPDLERIWKNEAHHIHTSLQLSHQKGIIKCRCAT